MKPFALSVEVGRETRLEPEASPLKAFHTLGLCTCLYVDNWLVFAPLLGNIDYQRKWPLLIELKVDFFFSLNKSGAGEVKSKSPVAVGKTRLRPLRFGQLVSPAIIGILMMGLQFLGK